MIPINSFLSLKMKTTLFQFVIGPDEQFRDVVVRYPGSCHDSYIFSNSMLKQRLEEDPTRGFLFGDSGYALSPVLLTPFHNPNSPQEHHFNSVHSRVRSQVERSIGKQSKKASKLEIVLDGTRNDYLILSFSLLHANQTKYIGI